MESITNIVLMAVWVLGGMAALLVGVLGLYFFMRRRTAMRGV